MENATPLPAKLLKQLKATKLPKAKQKDYPNLIVGGPGRNTKYNPQFVEELEVYLTTDKLPTVEGFALHLKVDDTTLLNWANKVVEEEVEKDGKMIKKKRRLHPDFFATIKRLKMLQKKQLMIDGLYGYQKVNPIMAIFLLKVNHGMVETSNLDLTSKGKELPTPIYGGQSTK